jgi:hypothetical protein
MPPKTQVVPVRMNCPSCGVAVVVGYERCQRCHTLLPKARGVAAGSRGGLILVLLLLAGVGALVWYFTRGGDDDPPPPSAGPSAGGGRAPAAGGGSSGAGQPQDPATLTREQALEGMVASMANRNLEGTVEVHASTPDVVDIRSAHCDGRMRDLVGSHADRLRRTGVTAVRCVGPDDAEVFAEPL